MIIRRLGQRDYAPVWRAMQVFTARRQGATPDECWCLEHPAVFTQGRNGRPEHLLNAGNTPVVRTDRGGQITYHGPGQVVIYPLVDLRRLNLGVHAFVDLLEQSIIGLLAGLGIRGQQRANARGVYVAGDKIAALGLRVSRGCTYHGLSFNVNMDLEPFTRIHPCGYAGLGVTRLCDQGVSMGCQAVARGLVRQLRQRLNAHVQDHPPGYPPGHPPGHPIREVS